MVDFTNEKLWKTLIITLLILSIHTAASAQEVLKGRIADDKTGEPLVGAVLKIKDTEEGSVTDIDGNYEFITSHPFPFTLVVKFAGYEQKEVEIYEALDEDLSIKLKNSSLLNEVVVVGYGTQKRSDVTGSVATVSEEILKTPVTSVDKLLQGSVAGVQVTQSSGQPGGSVSIRIRGGNSINGGNEPLYVIDGFPVYNDNNDANAGVTAGPSINALASLNPSDIESIDVLKDASATAIYGSRGANGVVIITTKKGKAGQNNISYDSYYGVSQVIKTLDVLTDAKQWAQLRNDARINSGKTPYYTQGQIDSMSGGTDWQKEAFRQAGFQNHQVTFRGGDEKTRFSISGNYYKQNGVLENTDFKRYSGRFNLEHNFSQRFRVAANLTGSQTSAQTVNDQIVRFLLLMPPTVPVKDANGNYTYQSEFETPLGNPIATLKNITNRTNTFRLLGNIYGDYTITKGLTARVSIGTDLINNKQNVYIPSTIYQGANSNSTGTAAIGAKFTNTWLNENTLNYSTNIGKNHKLNAVAGFTQQYYKTESVTGGSQQFVSDALTYNDLSTGAVYTKPTSNTSDWGLQSFLGRVNYSYAQKYYLTITGRADGSSRFGKNNKWGFFPSAALAWNINRESFLASNDYISNLKLRLSGGLTGNQEIGLYQSLSTLSTNTYFFNNQTVIGFSPNRISNPDLSWERTKQFDAGVDIAILNNRVDLTIDAYYKKTSDLLLNVPIPYTTGQSTALQNYGVVSNKGIELALTTQNVKTEKFNWTTSFVYSLNRNKVESLGDGVDYVISGQSIAKVGQPLGSFYGYKSIGIYQTGEATPGNIKYADINGDGQITQDRDRVVIGNAQPKFLAGLTNNFYYKNFDVSIFFYASYGNKVFNQNRQQLEQLTGQQNASTAALDRWTTSNPSTTMPRAFFEDATTVVSDRFVEDASFLRLKNIVIGYTLPAKLTNKAHIGKARFYIAAQNILTLTKYTGYDPEVSKNEQTTLTQGVDYGVYPNSKSYQVGLNVTF
ncbi:MAG: TonB-dependent receptor [Sporocytophaga sp.]|nr:TonB-dependent receptor [Sporocytophaga sp.]